MTLQELLNSDVATLGEAVRRGFAWWTGELADLAPPRWRRLGGGDRPVAALAADGQSLSIRRGGRVFERRAGDRPWTGPADLGLPAGAVLQREVVLPALGLDDMKRLVAHDLDRLTPFRPDQVYFDLEPVQAAAPPGRRMARLGVIFRADAEAALHAARRFGLEPRRLGVRIEGEGLRFDFLGPMRAAGRGGRPDRALIYWWSAVAVLAAANLTALVLKDMDDVAALRQLVDLQRPTAALALKLRQRVESEAQARDTLLTRRARNEPLRVLDAATRAFPPPQWVQRLEWNGRLVRIVGYRDPAFDVLAAARTSGLLARARTLSGSEAPTPGARPSFDLVAEPDPEGRR
jgi:general secretion pathway protein L